MGKSIKYMGLADVVRLEKGENFGGRLADPLTADVQWDWDNGHTIDTDEAGLSSEAVALILEDGDRFKDVSGLKRIPTNQAEQTWKAMPAHLPASEAAPAEESSADTGASGTDTSGTEATPAKSTGRSR